jgi:hypothetical protein
MKIIMAEKGSRDGYFGTWQVERFLSWLGGVDTNGLSVGEKLVSANLPHGITIKEATAEQLGYATKVAMETFKEESETIVKCVFSSLTRHDAAKGEAAIRSVISAIPVESVPKFVRIAVRARPSLALSVARAAATLVPEETDHIASAVESVVTTAY